MDLTATLIEKIFNPALVKIAEKVLTGVSDTSTQADKCKIVYELTRNTELRERIWNSTVKRVMITKDGTDPEYKWDYRYLEPSDSIYIISVKDDYDFTIESGYIKSDYTDSSNQLGVKYVQAADITSGTALDAEVTRWDTGLLNVMVCRVAAELAMVLKKKQSSQEKAWALYERALEKSAIANDFEDRHDRHNRNEEESSWVSCRGGD